MKTLLILIAAGLALVGNIPYLIDVIQKRVKPHPYSWFVWSIVSMVTLIGGIQKGAGLAALAIAASEVFTILIFLFALRNGIKDSFKNVAKKDTIFLVIALLGLIPWFITKDPTISVVVVVCIDLVAFIPTLIKTYKDPESETYLLYSMNIVRHLLILLTVSQFNLATTFHSFAMIVTNTMMTLFIVKSELTKKNLKEVFTKVKKYLLRK